MRFKEAMQKIRKTYQQALKAIVKEEGSVSSLARKMNLPDQTLGKFLTTNDRMSMIMYERVDEFIHKHGKNYTIDVEETN